MHYGLTGQGLESCFSQDTIKPYTRTIGNPEWLALRRGFDILGIVQTDRKRSKGGLLEWQAPAPFQSFQNYCLTRLKFYTHSARVGDFKPKTPARLKSAQIGLRPGRVDLVNPPTGVEFAATGLRGTCG